MRRLARITPFPGWYSGKRSCPDSRNPGGNLISRFARVCRCSLLVARCSLLVARCSLLVAAIIMQKMNDAAPDHSDLE